MTLDEAQQRQAVMHGVADAMAGVTRLPVVNEVYDEQYWTDYQAGLAAWRDAEERKELPAGYRPPPAPTASTPAGGPHPDPALADRGWQAQKLYLCPAPAAEPGPAEPFAAVMLTSLRETGDWPQRGRTVMQERQVEQLAEQERQWAADPSADFGLDADGPEAG
jgi:hypothetical protein